ncbi:MAG: lytic transglycosylase domain-containing protein [Gemmatimonadota bacterium]|nr:lytic transglycosylase domain-containing protein [Gemmatimonadota bacterium]
MGASALVAGLERASFVTGSTDESASSAPIALAYLSSSVKTSDLAKPVTNVASAMFDIHMDHPRVEKWVARLTTTLKGDLKQPLERMDKYAAMINTKLDARQMPRELAYLALIESNFNPTARSRVSAVGMWQFMSATARQFGLTARGGVDERKNPAKSTDAALTYLSQLHDRFGSWYLAAAAYNSGAGTVSKALRKVTGQTRGTDEDFFRILSALPKETQDYAPKLIATARVGSDPVRYGL